MEITPQRLRELELSEEKLNALEAHGVDNWEGYGTALEEIEERQEREGIIDRALDEAVLAIRESAFEPSERGAGWASTEEAAEEARDIILTALEELLNKNK